VSWVAVAIGGSAVLGGVGSYLGAKTQANSADKATQAQTDMFNRTQANLAPWMQSGNLALSDLNTRLGLSSPGIPGTPATGPHQAGGSGFFGKVMLPGTPGTPGVPASDPNSPNFGQLTHQFNLQDFQESPAYQFNLQQGKLALDKASAARGKFYAPSTLQDIAKYSQGLASNEYQNAFSNYNTNMGNIFNRLNSVSGAGQNAAANLGTNATAVGGQIGNNMIGAGNANAAGIVGGVNALTGGISNYLNYNLLSNFMERNQASSVRTPMDPNLMAG